MSRTSLAFDDAVRMATRTPAELMGVKKGKLEPGWDADLLIIDEDMEINTVIINGEVFWERVSYRSTNVQNRS